MEPGTRLRGSVILLAIAIAAPQAVQAVNTCGGVVAIDYVSGPNFAITGSVLRVRVDLGAGAILGGTKLTVNRLRFELDCTDSGGGVPCTDLGNVVEYEGDATITSDCTDASQNLVSWSTGHGLGANPNEVVFTPSAPLAIPAASLLFCNLEFDLKLLSQTCSQASPDLFNPCTIFQFAGYALPQADAQCDNGLGSGSQQAAAYGLCNPPTGAPCNDHDPCTADACDTDTGECTFTHLEQCQPTTETPTRTPTPTPTHTPTETPTCAPTGTPYCSNQCIPCPTVRPSCYINACGACIQNPSCGGNEACVPNNFLPAAGCCSCATLTPTPTPTGAVVILEGTAVGRPGGIACVLADLIGGASPSTISNQIGYQASSFTLQDAVINPNLAPPAGLSHMPAGSGVESFTVSTMGQGSIPDGLLYTAEFAVHNNVQAGTYGLSGTPGGAIRVTNCDGDCNGNNAVSIGEVTRCVNLFLGQPLCNVGNPILNCPVADSNNSGGVSIGEVTQCVNRFLLGCE